MALRASRGNERIAHCDRERKIGQSIAVQMAELSSIDTKFESAESMRSRHDTRPTLELPADAVCCVFHARHLPKLYLRKL